MLVPAPQQEPAPAPELTEDTLIEIAKRIQSLSDYVRFASICWSWRNAALPKDRRRRPWVHFPGLLLVVNNSTRRKMKPAAAAAATDLFLPIGGRQIRLPPRVVLQPGAAAKEWLCRGTYQGWVVLVKMVNPENGLTVRLRNPAIMAGDDQDNDHDILLPPLDVKITTFFTVEKAVVSSDPAAAAGRRRGSCCYVLLLYAIGHAKSKKVALCKFGGGARATWKTVEMTPSPERPASNNDDRDAIAIHSKSSSKFYILDRGVLHLLDPSAAAKSLKTTILQYSIYPPAARSTLFSSDTIWGCFYSDEDGGRLVTPHLHLAALSGGEVLLIVRLVERDNRGRPRLLRFIVYRRRRQLDCWVEANDLDGEAVFIGTHQASFSLRPGGGPLVEKDHIYFVLQSSFDRATTAGWFRVGDHNEPLHLIQFKHGLQPRPFWFLPMPWRSSSSSCSEQQLIDPSCLRDGGRGDDYNVDGAIYDSKKDNGHHNRFESLLTHPSS